MKKEQRTKGWCCKTSFKFIYKISQEEGNNWPFLRKFVVYFLCAIKGAFRSLFDKRHQMYVYFHKL